MKVKIDKITFALADLETDPLLPEGQRTLYSALLTQTETTSRQLIKDLALHSPAPLRSRLKNLILKDKVIPLAA